ncbi:sensor histidine kinase [Anaeromyxobacter diazotrophicus]|uniref:histidine kinase n=1 Tax=Anaeromyxobacter diazotrophicus TaxID=2590199 RepID=A0A7I9VSQ7_9BACT|nr:ATP-binding protein [Anaeromyxobacter diazotrophicus]GEJ59160.1 hybrid sensor histidine kinase/response regulator [Anaeromyxobacter diazotrophicus]
MSQLHDRPRVLVVDDNATLVENLTEILEEAGYAVRGHGTCAEALHGAREQGFDVALVDLRLPDGDGTALAPQLKEVAPDGEVVLLTGFATLESAVAAVRAGACAYLVKPCATQELLVTVEQAMRQVRLHGEKRELSRRAQMAEKLAAVGTMTAGLSHEIRNPLNAAALQLTVLERRLQRLPAATQPPLLEPLQLVRDEIRRLDHILEDFLQFARPREFQPHPVEVATVLTKVLDLLEGEAERRHIALERDLQPVPRVAGDEERLRQVVMNLALNALDAVGRGGTVRVSCQVEEPASGEVAIYVDDSGPGIAPELRDRIFEPFFTTKAQGSGLGLSIVHAIVVQHGGSITIEDAPGGGARFALRLPAAR